MARPIQYLDTSVLISGTAATEADGTARRDGGEGGKTLAVVVRGRCRWAERDHRARPAHPLCRLTTLTSLGWSTSGSPFSARAVGTLATARLQAPTTELHTGGGGWQEYALLELSIRNRNDVFPRRWPSAGGTAVTWVAIQGTVR